MGVVLFTGKTGLSEAGGFACRGKAVLASEFSLQLGSESLLGSQHSHVLLVFRAERAMG